MSLIKLAIAAISNSIESLDWKYHLGIVGQQKFVAIEFHLDGFEHIHCVPFIAANEANEFSVAIERSPDACAFTDRGLT